MAITTADEFFAVLEKSRLLEPEQLADARRANQNGSDPTEIARILARDDLITRWQAGQLLAGRSSFYLGKYKLIELLGRGGMGSVFLGQHVTMNRRVALKIISKRLGSDPAALERFLAEARAIAALDHTNIVQAYSVDNENDRYYIVMEYVDGKDLQRMVDEEGPLEFDLAGDYIRQAADGLTHAHEQHMIHCDIKPSNLLVNSQGVVKILDLGLTRVKGADPSDSSEEDILGSVDYLSPEQALETPDFDHRADIYSLGCTLYFLLTGHPPFPDGTLPERILKHQTQLPKPIEDERPDTPRKLIEICEKMMAKKPEDRYQTASKLSKALAAWQPPPRKVGAKGGRVPPVKKPGAQNGNGMPVIALQEEAGRADDAWSSTVSEAGGAATGFAGIKLSDDKPSDSKKVPTAKESSKDVPGVAPQAKPGLLSTPQRKLIAAGAGALLLLLLAVGISLPFILGGGDEAQATTTAGATGEEPREEPGGEAEAPAEGESDLDGSVENEVPPGEENGEPDESIPEEPPEEDPGTEEPTPEEPATPPEETPDVTATVESPPDEEPPTEPAPEQQPAAEKPEPEQTPPKPKDTDPLKAIAGMIELPPLRGGSESDPAPGTPVSIGKLALKPDSIVSLKLLGGENVVKGNQRYLIQDVGGNKWLVKFESAAREGEAPEQTDVAGIWVDDQQDLKIKWLPGALDARAEVLQSCGLLVDVNTKTKCVALGKPEQAQPIDVNLQRSIPVSLTSDRLPDPSSLRLQITGLLGQFPQQHSFKPADTMHPKGYGPKPEGRTRTRPKPGELQDGEIAILFQEKNTPNFGLIVTFTARGKTIRLDTSAIWQPPGQPQQGQQQEQPLQSFSLGQLNLVRMQLMQLHGRAEATTKVKNVPGPIKKQAQDAMKQLDAAIEQLNSLQTMCGPMEKNGHINYRIFTVADGQEIDLFTTEAAAVAIAETPVEDDEDLLDLSGGDEEENGGSAMKGLFD